MAETAKFLFDTEFDVSDAVAGESQAKLLTGREIQDLRDSAFEAGVNEGAAREIKTTEHRPRPEVVLIGAICRLQSRSPAEFGSGRDGSAGDKWRLSVQPRAEGGADGGSAVFHRRRHRCPAIRCGAPNVK